MLTENKEGQMKSEDLGKDIASVQALMSKHVREAKTAPAERKEGRDGLGSGFKSHNVCGYLVLMVRNFCSLWLVFLFFKVNAIQGNV